MVAFSMRPNCSAIFAASALSTREATVLDSVQPLSLARRATSDLIAGLTRPATCTVWRVSDPWCFGRISAAGRGAFCERCGFVLTRGVKSATTVAVAGCIMPAVIRPGGYLSCITPVWFFVSKIFFSFWLFIKRDHLLFVPNYLSELCKECVGKPFFMETKLEGRRFDVQES